MHSAPPARRPAPVALAWLLLAATASTGLGQSQTSRPVQAAPESASPALSIRCSPALALHMRARAAAGRGELGEPLPRLAAAVDEAAGAGRVWLALEPSLAGGDLQATAARLASLPLDRLVAEKAEPTRAALAAYLDSLAAALPAFERDQWPALKAAQELRAERLGRALGGGDDPLLRRTLAALRLSGAGAARIELTPEAPPPGAFTYRSPAGPVSIVGDNGLDDDTLLEVALHEAIHAFDSMATGERTDALAQMRAALLAAGLDERDPRFRAAWHALFFVHAAEMVRRDGRSGYVDYGERFGVYEKAGGAAGLMRDLWPRVLDREIELTEFAERVALAARAG
ncbi:MAG TPA: hypothetical protein VFF69_12825 [Phycisphaerales bacterium]|nr:hypothetical protein [Phycisphaerales bacterium]